MLEALRAEVLEANLELVRRGLVIYTFGNASGVSREHGLCVIKPSGVPYEKMTPADMVVTDLDGRVVGAADLVDAPMALVGAALHLVDDGGADLAGDEVQLLVR